MTGLNGGVCGSLGFFIEVQQLYLDIRADCSVCLSAPFITLCLTTYNLVCPGKQAEGQMDGWDGY